MQKNVIDAIVNLVHNPVVQLCSEYKSRNRANSEGEALEEYVKDLFAGTFDCSPQDRMEEFEKVFSYLGNNSNPPDSMLWGGDAIEIKKIGTLDAALALNSSYPKHTIKSSSTMISEECRNAEQWDEKDMLYVVGIVRENMLRHLAMVYGLDYCASESCYHSLKDKIARGVNSIGGVEFSETRELGRVNRVDPLGITYMRVRGMWGIENPWTVFRYIYQRDMRKKLNFMCLININKWERLSGTNRLTALSKDDGRVNIQDVKIKNPDNPARLNNAKLITFTM